MRIAYLVFAYKNPKLLNRTIGRLTCEDVSFFIHIDSKADINQFASIQGGNITFAEKRIPVYWAEFSGVEAILLLIRQALAAGRRYDYFALLSGSEYLLRSREYIHSFLESNRGSEFINCVKMPNAAAGKPISRIATIRFPSTRPVARFAVRVLAKAGLAQRDYRKYLGNLEPYGGNTWWTLTREACEYISDFDRSNPHVAAYFGKVFSPEEYFIHTILGNSPFRQRMRRSLVFEDWSTEGGHPAMIGENHIAFFESQEKVSVNDVHGPGEMLFARKFSDDNLALISRVNEMIQRKERQYSVV